MSDEYSSVRMRRYRKTARLRRMLDDPFPSASKLIWPVFIKSGSGVKEAIESMPGQYRMSCDVLIEELARVSESGVNAVMLFGVIDDDLKDAEGSLSRSERGVVQDAIRTLRSEYPDLLICTDVCLCGYTSHGHCGAVDESGTVDNDSTLKLLAGIALSHAEAGADIVAPSAMMDGQVRAIRTALDDGGFSDTVIMSYSTKFASALYGPFRDAAASSPGSGDRKGYQASFANADLALRESILDEQEGADILMVKPAGYYLDVIRDVKEASTLPLAAYNVSGEYSMVHAMAEKGWGDLYSLAAESVMAISRAGADIVITYWADQYEKLKEVVE